MKTSTRLFTLLAAPLIALALLVAAPASAATNITVATDSDYEQLMDTDDLVLIKFWASWCGWCEKFRPVWEGVAAENDGVAGIKFIEIDFDTNKESVARFGIRGVPNTVILKRQADGSVLYGVAGGYMDADKFKDLISRIQSGELALPATLQ